MLSTLISLCSCPRSTALTAIPASTCKENFGQIQRLLFQRTRDDAGAYQTITIGTSDPVLKATWTALVAAVDDTKVVVTPIIGNPNNEPGEAIKFGGGNTTPNGNQIIVGQNGGQFTCDLYAIKQNIIAAIKALKCEELSVFFVNGNDQIAAFADDLGSPTTIRGFEIEDGSFFTGDKVFGNFEGIDLNPLEFSMKPNWSDTFHIISPSFSPLKEL